MEATPDVKKFTARKSDELSAHVVQSSPLTYDDETSEDVQERPDHVRAASSLVYLIDRFVLVQDDANFLGLVDPDSHRVRGVPLPPAPDGARVHDDAEETGEHQHKLDLEACAADPATDGRFLIAFGSGSPKTREWIVTVDWRDRDHDGEPDTRLIETPAFHGMLRQHREFTGSGLNEGAIFLDDDRLRLFQRGNAEPRDDIAPVDATGDVSWSELRAYLDDPTGAKPPSVTNVRQYDLGALDGVRLTFSDAEARWAELFDEDGEPFTGKVEGLSRKPDERDHVYFVIDSDVADQSSRLYEADLDGPWYSQF